MLIVTVSDTGRGLGSTSRTRRASGSRTCASGWPRCTARRRSSRSSAACRAGARATLAVPLEATSSRRRRRRRPRPRTRRLMPPRSSPKTSRCCARSFSARLAEAWPELAHRRPRRATARRRSRSSSSTCPTSLFLDIRMPVKSGLDVARALAGRCHVVFVTAYDEYAVAAFEEGAVDYVLKPVTAERIAKVVAAPQGAARQRRLLDLTALLARLAAREAHGAAAMDSRIARQRDAADRRRRRRVLPGRGQVHEGRHRRRRGADQEADQGALRGARPEAFWQIHRGTIVNLRAMRASSATGATSP